MKLSLIDAAARSFAKTTVVAVMALPLLAGFTHGAKAEKFILASPFLESDYMTTNNKAFAEDVKRKTGGKVDITVRAGATLFKAPEIMRAVETKQVAFGEIALNIIANLNPIYGFESIPFVTKDKDDAAKLWKAARPYVERALDKQGLKLLFGVSWPGAAMFTKKEINSFKDLEGTKFRVQSPNAARLIELMNVTGVRVETADLPQAMLTGIIDGFYTSIVTAANSKSWDYIKYAYDTNAWYPMNITFINKEIWNRLDKKTQETVLHAAATAEKRGWDMEVGETKKKAEELRMHGVKVVVPPDSLITPFRTIGKQMLAEWLEKTGKDGADLIAAFNKERGM
jgi:TRAP-type C4-dicarboxylate transport system substrate-binding protein